MALQVVVATFAAPLDTVAITYSTPPGTLVVAPSNPNITSGASSSVWADSVTPTGCNIKSAAPIVGTVVVFVLGV